MEESIIAIIGAITGSVSLGILIYKTWKEKPSLNFTLEDAFWYTTEPSSNLTYISITVKIDNKGGTSTTIHDGDLSFEYEQKTHNLKDKKVVLVSPNSTIRHGFEFAISKNVIMINGDIMNGNLKIDYTHNTRHMPIPRIKKS